MSMKRKNKRCHPDDKDYMLKYAMGLLKRRPYPIYIIRKKLLSKGCNEEIVEEIMVELKEVIGEDILTREYLESLYLGACRKGKGPKWFIHRALSEGVPEDVVNSYVESVEWIDALRVCVEKAKRRYGSDIYKIKGFLYRNGFSDTFWDIVEEMLKEG